MNKSDLTLYSLKWLICHKTKQNKTKSYLSNIYKEDLALNNLQWLIYHKTQPKEIISI